MGLQIEDGKGTGVQAQVDGQNRLMTSSVVIPEIHSVNINNGRTYSLVVNQTPSGANKCFAYIKNTSAIRMLILDAINLSAAGAETVQIKFGDVGTAVGTTGTAVNRNTSSAYTPDATIVVGNDITGVSGGSLIDQYVTVANQTSMKYHWDSGLILGTSGVVSFYAVAGSIAIKMTLSLYFQEAD